MISIVTGGAGFIGSYLVKSLLAKKESAVIVLDSLTYASDISRLPNSATKNYQFFKVDIADSNKVMSTIAEIRKEAPSSEINIYNLAAESHVDRSIVGGNLFVDSNVRGTQNLLEAASANKIKRFLQVSTDEVYGSIEFGEATEESPLNPSSAYSASKAAADLLVSAHAKTHGLDIVISRCVNNFGEGQLTEKFIPRMIYKALHGVNLPVYGDGKNVREWLHVSDHVNALLLLMEKGDANEIYNIGSGFRMNNVEVANLILGLLPASKSKIEFMKDRLGHDSRYAVSHKKILDNLGWNPKIDFNDQFKYVIKAEALRIVSSDSQKLELIESFYERR